MKSALIGYTGFVGGNILNQMKFDDLYNSSNINTIQNKHYDLLVSAGTKAEVWKANQNPTDDWLGIKNLLDNLEKVTAKHVILISTILVYPKTIEVDEDTHISGRELSTPYGKHRLQMEQFFTNHFSKVTIVRLSQIFGQGLKKNFIYDLIHDNALDFTHKDSQLQVYNLKYIWKDIQRTIENDIPIINLVPQPVTAREIAQYTRGLSFQTITQKPPLKFDVWTKYGNLWNSTSNYLYTRQLILNELKEFVHEHRTV